MTTGAAALLLAASLSFGAPVAAAAQDSASDPMALSEQTPTEKLRPVPWPDVAGLEPAVQEALQQAAEAFAARSAEEAADGPGTAEAYGQVGMLYQAQGFPAAAESCYDNAALLAPEDFRWPHLLGLVLLDEQRFEAAAAAFADAFRRRAYYPALLREARAEQALGNLEKADALLAIAGRHSPNDPAFLAAAGEQAGLTGRNGAAIELLSRALAAAPGATRLHYPLALAYRALGDESAAAEHLELAGRVGIVPLDPLENQVLERRVGATAWDLDGQRALQVGDAASAAEAFQKASAARPDDPELLSRLGAAEAASGHLAEAAASLARAVELAPDRTSYRLSLAALLYALNDPAAALAHLQLVVAARPGDSEAQALLAAARAALDPARSDSKEEPK